MFEGHATLHQQCGFAKDLWHPNSETKLQCLYAMQCDMHCQFSVFLSHCNLKKKMIQEKLVYIIWEISQQFQITYKGILVRLLNLISLLHI